MAEAEAEVTDHEPKESKSKEHKPKKTKSKDRGSRESESKATESKLHTARSSTGDGEKSESHHRHRSHHDKKKKKKRKRLPKDKKHFQFEKIPGVIKMYLSVDTQKSIGLVVGDDVTGENPWKAVEKENIDFDLEVHEGSSEFLPIKPNIELFPPEKKTMLLGYIPSEEPTDEFYICISQEAEDEVSVIIEKLREEQEEFMRQAVSKKAKFWKSRGTGQEIDDEIYKRHRELYEVEVESRYPIMKDKVEFRVRNVVDVRDGYAEMLKGRSGLEPVIKSRIHRGTQSAAICEDRDMQTPFAFPTNAWTQYEYDYEVPDNYEKLYQVELHQFFNKTVDLTLENLYVNAGINFYKNDYLDVVLDKKFTQPYRETEIREYISFTEVHICNDKMVGSVSWHPFITGIVVCCYVDTHLCNYLHKKPNESNTAKVVYNMNPVLVWSYVDPLKPKLKLQAHREVNSIAYCPYDDGLIVGGCRNGQIILWDVAGKINRVEEEEVITPLQHSYRVYMFSFMKWMKNIRDISSVPVTAISDLKYSHGTTVTSIQWLPPFYEMSRSGHLTRMPQDEDHTTPSYQFVTTSIDGHIKFWDLKQKPVYGQAGDYKPQRKLRRLKRRPSALLAETSPYRILNRMMRPNYDVLVQHPDVNHKVPISCMSMLPFEVNYIEHDFSVLMNKKTKRMAARRSFRPVLENDLESFPQTVCLGTSEGDFKKISWEGFDYTSGQIVCEEVAIIENTIQFHDGPVITLERWSVDQKILLSAGGRIFCIWHEDFNRPVIWRKNSAAFYSFGSWGVSDPNTFKLLKSDGTCEVWAISLKSNQPTSVLTVSGHMITGVYVQPLCRQTCAIGDYNGSLRICRSLSYSLNKEASYIGNSQKTKKWLERQIEILSGFYGWQERWQMRFQHLVKAEQEAEEERQKLQLEEEQKLRAQREIEEEMAAKEAERLRQEKLHPPRGRYKEWAEGIWKEKEMKRMYKTLLRFKQLDGERLLKENCPMKEIQEEDQKKHDKMRNRNANSEKIFNDNVAMHFPHMLQKPPPPKKNPYAGGDSHEAKQYVLNHYKSNQGHLGKYIKKNPFRYNFDWRDLVNKSKSKAKEKEPLGHRERWMKRKLEKEKMGKVKVEEVIGDEGDEGEQEELGDESLELEYLTYSFDYGFVDPTPGEEE